MKPREWMNGGNKKTDKKRWLTRTSLVVQQWRLHTSTTRCVGLIPGHRGSACQEVRTKKERGKNWKMGDSWSVPTYSRGEESIRWIEKKQRSRGSWRQESFQESKFSSVKCYKETLWGLGMSLLTFQKVNWSVGSLREGPCPFSQYCQGSKWLHRRKRTSIRGTKHSS